MRLQVHFLASTGAVHYSGQCISQMGMYILAVQIYSHAVLIRLSCVRRKVFLSTVFSTMITCKKHVGSK